MKKRKQEDRFRDLLNYLGTSYAFALVIFLITILVAVDWSAKRRRESERKEPVTTTTLVTSVNPAQETPWSFFHPIWNQEDHWTIFPSETPEQAKLPNSKGDLAEFLEDPENHLEAEFKVPAGLKKRVLFWMEIYAKYNSRIRVIHDRDNPSIIYGYVDLRPLYRAYGPGQITESKASNIEIRVVKELKARLSEAIGASNTSVLTPKEKDEIRGFLSSVGALSVKETLHLIESVRSQSGQRDMFIQALYRSANLLPHIETVFKLKNLPRGLGHIPFVESSFNVKALSSDGAVGIWQFMPSTAKQMISRNEESHWTDPLKQTASAAKLFQIYRSMLPDWSTTVTAYNSGVGRLRKLCQRYGVKSVEGLINVPARDGLGFAGQNFYSEFLAAHLVESYKEKIFSKMLGPIDLSLVFRGVAPFPKEICDL